MLDAKRPAPARSDLLESLAQNGVRHGFFTRRGGVSRGIYEGLNVGRGSGDDAAHVEENRNRAAAWLHVAPQNLVTLHQIHSADAVIVAAPFTGERAKADALVTDRPGLALGVLTADCGPVLFADSQARVIGAAHAGWKGALTGVLEATIEAMERLGADRSRIRASLGPSISAAAYEVGPEFIERFVVQDGENARYFTPSKRDGHAMFDLPAYTVDRLGRAGLAVDLVARCTYGDASDFYSYRRSTHRREPDYGRQLSAIVLEN